MEGGVDIDGKDGDAVALRIVDEDLDRIEAHGLGIDQPDEELGRVEELEEGRLIGRTRECRCVALREAETREPRDTPKELFCIFSRHLSHRDAAIDEAGMELLHLRRRAPRAHRTAEAVGLRRREARHLDRDPHHLLLVEDDAERIAQDRLEGRMQVGHRLQALAAAEVGVDGVPLDRSRANDRDLHDEVVERRGA